LAVAYFGAAKVTHLETADPEEICREGLTWLSEATRARGADQFLSLPEQQQTAIIQAISDARLDMQAENAGTRFFTLLKTETVRGYYTSQAGLKELDYKGNAFYARSPGCDSKSR
jgi:Gluconate 2-dehydrogenase subunit 3